MCLFGILVMKECVVFYGNEVFYKGNDLAEAKRVCGKTSPSRIREFDYNPEEHLLKISGYVHRNCGVKYVDSIKLSGASLEALLAVLEER